MARVVVDVMLKPEILDPQGKAVAEALPRLGFDGIADVRQGKRFELEVDGEVTEERLAQIRGAAETLLSNPVIEDFTVRVEDAPDLMRVGVVTFPGSLDDADAARAFGLAGGEPVALWHGDADLHGVDAVVLPGGFSYGDYLRCGAIARFAPVMEPLVGRRERRPAGARHLQRLPGALRVAPAAGRADPQRPPQVHLRRPAAGGRERRRPRGRRATPPARRSSSR